MITGEHQYRITKSEMARFENALAQSVKQNADLHPKVQQTLRAGVESQLEELRQQLSEYEALGQRS